MSEHGLVPADQAALARTQRTFIAVVLDRSGSMESLRRFAVTGFNEFLQSQQSIPGEATIMVVQFNDYPEILMQPTPIGAARPLTMEDFKPSGSTALYDAFGFTIHDVLRRIERLQPLERPAKVIVLVITDGMENASKRFSCKQVEHMVHIHREMHGWEFIMLGAGAQVAAQSASVGVDPDQSSSYHPSEEGMTQAYRGASETIQSIRIGQPTSLRDNMDPSGDTPP